jgi:hypothetical protein
VDASVLGHEIRARDAATASKVEVQSSVVSRPDLLLAQHAEAVESRSELNHEPRVADQVLAGKCPAARMPHRGIRCESRDVSPRHAV